MDKLGHAEKNKNPKWNLIKVHAPHACCTLPHGYWWVHLQCRPNHGFQI